jgi:heptosyltransferase-1
LRRWRGNLFDSNTRGEMSAFRKRLAGHRYDWVLDTQGLLKSALIVAFARGQKHGHDWGSAREPLASLFYRQRHAVARGQHAVDRNRELAAQALGYALHDSPPDYGIRASAGIPPLGLPGHYVVALHATSRDSKLWPVEHWIALGRQLAGTGLGLVLPWGNDSESRRAHAIAAAVPQAMVLPRSGLAHLAAVLAGARAAVGVDTGLAHLAVALEVPTVAIYTDTDPALTGLLAPQPALARNLGGIGLCPPVESVMAALQAVATLSNH